MIKPTIETQISSTLCAEGAETQRDIAVRLLREIYSNILSRIPIMYNVYFAILNEEDFRLTIKPVNIFYGSFQTRRVSEAGDDASVSNGTFIFTTIEDSPRGKIWIIFPDL